MKSKTAINSQLIGMVMTCIMLLAMGCQHTNDNRIAVIIDTDANNELDDQHAMAYLFLNGNSFTVPGVTVNATKSGGDIEGHRMEAERIMRLCNVQNSIPLFKGANGSFEEILPTIGNEVFDGSEAVNFIVEEANRTRKEKLVLLPIGKLTNIALALAKDPSIVDKVNIVWLGSNYPEPGEYNQDNDVPAMNYVLNLDVPFEMVTVRYGKETGTAHVFVTKEEILAQMPRLGPTSEPVEGRHGGTFTNFGDYSVNLFEHCEFYGEPPHRALFDMAAVAILKNPAFAQHKEIPCPKLVENGWIEQPDNTRKIIVWENFNRDAITTDFYASMKNYKITGK